MKIAIHKSNWGFSPDWIKYCQQNGVPYKIVNCYDSDIVTQLKDCTVLLWHHHHILAKDKTFAKGLLFALEQSGMRVFPDFNTGWHFDDKVGQKYLLEAIGAPLVPTNVFYDKITALNFVSTAKFPLVFKLRGGAGSTNVKLIKSHQHAKKLITKAFGKGFPSHDKWEDIREHYRKLVLGKASFYDMMKSIRRFFIGTEFARIHEKEKGYVVFQEFIPNNTYDIRVVVIGSKAFALKRNVRANDFRASGSGFIEYDKHLIDERCISIAFEVTKKMKANCVAFDFVFNAENKPLIVEINYGFAHEAYFKCPGYWDEQLNWHEESFNSAHWIVQLYLN